MSFFYLLHKQLVHLSTCLLCYFVFFIQYTCSLLHYSVLNRIGVEAPHMWC